MRGSSARVGALVFLAYAGLRLYAFLGVPIQTTRDSTVYAGMANQWSVFDSAFYAGRRPLGLPLLYKLAGGNTALVWIQLLVSIAAWALLAVVVAGAISDSRLRFGAFVAVLALSLARPVTVWDRIVLTESLSISVGVVLLATLALVLRRSTPARVACAVLAFVAWAFLRDTNALVGGLVLLLLAGVFLQARRRRLAATFAAVAIAVAFASQISANAGDRWEHPLMNVIGRRVLPSQEVRDYFVARGMPYDASVRRLSGFSSSQENYAFLKNGRLVAWTHAHGRSAYLSYLLSNPGYVLYWPLHDPDLLAPPSQDAFAAPSVAVLPGPIEEIVYPSHSGGAVFLVVVVLVLAAAFIRLRNREWLVPAAVLVSTPAHLLLVWHGDAIEVQRHAVLANVALRVACVWLAFLVIDAALRARRAPGEDGHGERRRGSRLPARAYLRRAQGSG